MNIFDPVQIELMRTTLTQVARHAHADSPTQALMAERILQSAAKGARSKEEFEAVALEAARSKAA